jgi:methionyl-tRNA synthetase
MVLAPRSWCIYVTILAVKAQVIYDDFAKLDLRVGEVTDAEDVKDSNRLLRLTVNFGPETGTRTIFAGIKKWYTPSSVRGRKLIFVTNLLPKRFKIGDQELESQGMLVAAGNEDCVLYAFDKDLEPGALVH